MQAGPWFNQRADSRLPANLPTVAATAATGFVLCLVHTKRTAVHDQRYGVNRAMLAEKVSDIIFTGAEGQVAHIDLLQGLFSKCRRSYLTKYSRSPACSGKSTVL